MYIERLDHVVLTVRDIEKTITFYRDVLGMQPQTFGDGRHALVFGQQKINLHRADGPFTPRAAHPVAGSADLCFVSSTPVREIVSQLEGHGVVIEEGPVERVGALGVMDSVYFRDPDGNLLEVSKYRA